MRRLRRNPWHRTLLGDPIEATALGAVLGRGRSPAHRLRIGSIKTNIGHTEAAAGIAGLIKVALSMAHRELPPSLHFQTPNPHIPFDALQLKVQEGLSPWGAAGAQPVFAGVSSFGFGGTNAHVVLESHGQVDSHLLALSAADADALERAVEALMPLVEAVPIDTPIETLSAAISVGAAAGPASLAVTFGTRQELSDRLAAVRRGEAVIPGVARRSAARLPGGLVFVFPGQGGHWPGMGRSLLAIEPAFRRAFVRCEHALQPFTDWSPMDVLLDTDSRLWSHIDVGAADDLGDSSVPGGPVSELRTGAVGRGRAQHGGDCCGAGGRHSQPRGRRPDHRPPKPAPASGEWSGSDDRRRVVARAGTAGDCRIHRQGRGRDPQRARFRGALG